METIEGTAAGPYFELSMTVGKATHVARSDTPLALSLPQGDLVALELGAARLAPNVDESGTFGELLAEGLAAPFVDRAPGDHVRVRIRGLRVDAGTRLVVKGRVERVAAPGSGYRDAGESLPHVVEARFVAAGDGAEDALSEAARAAERARVKETKKKTRRKRKRRRKARDEGPSLLLARVYAALSLGLAVAGIASGEVARGGAFGALSMYCGAVAIFAAARARFLPDLRSSKEDTEGSGKRTTFGGVLTVVLMIVTPGVTVFAGLIANASEVEQGQLEALAAVFGTVGVVALVLALPLAITQRRAFVRLWRLARARPSMAPGSFGAMDGRLVEGNVRRTRTHEFHRAEYEGDKLRAHAFWTYTDRLHPQRLTIALDSGETLIVQPKGGVFAAEQSIERGRRLIEEIRVGDAVRVVGRPVAVQGAWEVRSTGPDSLFVFGSRRRSGRAAAVRALSLHALGIAGLCAIAIIASVLGLVLRGMMP